MAEIYTKDNNGNLKSLGDADINKVKTVVNGAELSKFIKDFWTDKKSGKHPELMNKHKAILEADLLVSPKDLFEQLNANKFIFQNFGPVNISDFLRKAKLDSYLKPEFVNHALNVTTHQPAIGKGEFLLVSCFKNINFAFESGDLIDDDGNRIEVKGNHAPIGGPKGFKQMNKSLMFSIYRLFKRLPVLRGLPGCRAPSRRREALASVHARLDHRADDVQRRARAGGRAQAGAHAGALRPGRALLWPRALLQQDARAAAGRGQHDDARALPDPARQGGRATRPGEVPSEGRRAQEVLSEAHGLRHGAHDGGVRSRERPPFGRLRAPRPPRGERRRGPAARDGARSRFRRAVVARGQRRGRLRTRRRGQNRGHRGEERPHEVAGRHGGIPSRIPGSHAHCGRRQRGGRRHGGGLPPGQRHAALVVIDAAFRREKRDVPRQRVLITHVAALKT